MNKIEDRLRTTTKKKILIVDDEEIVREMLELQINGGSNDGKYEIHFASDGSQALDILSKDNNFSLIILDMIMKPMDGITFLEHKKNNQNLDTIPVLVNTSDHGKEATCYNLGAENFMLKGNESDVVIRARIDNIIQRYESKKLIAATNRDKRTDLLTLEYFGVYAEQFRDKEEEVDLIAIKIANYSLLQELKGVEYAIKISKVIGIHALKICNELSGIASNNSSLDTFYLLLKHHEERPDLFADLYHVLEENNIANADAIRFKVGVYEKIDRHVKMDIAYQRAESVIKKIEKDNNKDVEIYNPFEEELINEFDNAIKEKQFQVYYQPKYDITKDKPTITAAEALVRWIHPIHKMISPGLFIPMLERNGLILKLDEFVYNEVGKHIKEWKEKYHKVVPISINISRVELFDPDLKDRISKVIKDNDISPKDIHIEVTESAAEESTKTLADVVRTFKEMGIEIEIDDFGVGYSSLNSITELPFDVLKIDMKFIHDMDKGQVNKDIVSWIISLAKKLNVKTVAEGVETEEQHLFLKENGCDIIQGYYFSKPLPKEEFANKLIEE